MTGYSGAGKSTLVAALAGAGHATVAEPGRRAIARGHAPWADEAAFLHACVAIAEADLAATEKARVPVFFDRGLIDALAGLERLGDARVAEATGGRRLYARTVIFAPPWPAIYRHDAERRHDFANAFNEHDHLAALLPAMGHELAVLPEGDVAARLRFVEQAIGLAA